MNDIPIVCSLTDEEFRSRERDVVLKLMPSVLESLESEAGYAFHFSPNSETLKLVTEFIVLERQCCPFLDFKLTAVRGNGDVWLELSGPPGAKDFIATNFIK